MATIDSPFIYPEGTPQWKKERKREYRRQWWAKKLGREIGEWGGKREGAGRPKNKVQENFNLNLNNIQRMNLKEIGDGSIERGIQRLIDKNV
jgi:hypothetical protein